MNEQAFASSENESLRAKATRPFISCPNARKTDGRWEGGCGLATPLPRCFCRKDLRMGTDFWRAVPDGQLLFWVCSKRGSRGRRNSGCEFKQLILQGEDLRDDGEEDEDEDDDDGDENQCF